MGQAIVISWRRNRRLLDNFLSLSILQFANYVAPLITLPYLTRVLGDSRFGVTEFARAIALYFVIVTDYGFYLSATQEVSLHRDDPQKLSEIFSAVMVLKLLILVLSFLVLTGAVLAVPKMRTDWPVFLLSFGIVMGQCLFPVWLFQGLERMQYIASLNIAARAFVTIAIFVFIRHTSDYIYVPVLNSIGALLVGGVGLYLALRYLHVRFERPSLSALKAQLVGGWHLFASKMATTLYTTCNTIVLGLVTDNTYVAYYATGDKVVRAVQGLQLPLSQAIFPHISRLASESKEAALRFAARAARMVGIVMSVLSLALLLTAPYLARAAGFSQSTNVIRILSFLPLIIGLSNIFGVQVMVNFGMKRTMTRILTVAGVLSIVLALALVGHWRHIGISIAVLITEVFVTVAMYVALRRRGLDVLSVDPKVKS